MSDTEQNKNNKKELRNKVKAQLEFYFSDSNLSKDRFLKQEIQASEEGYVNLSVFLKFNKIRQLTSNVELLAKSLKKSDLLELNEDKTKVKRRVLFVEPTQKNTDKKTIYVENLPSKITPDLLKKHFQDKFGAVTYISLPKFQTSHQLKGFAFIEFAEKECAKQAVKFYESAENTQDIIGKFPKSHKIIIDLEKKIRKVEESIQYYDDKNQDTNEVASSFKRKDNDAELNESKKLKTNIKKSSLENLSVISKKTWLKLKEEFLAKQKAQITSLKQDLANLNDQLQQKLNNKYKEKNVNIKTDDITKACVIKLTLSPNDPEFEKVFKLSRQQFKNTYFQEKEDLDHIAYVDVEKNFNKILVRCNSSEAARAILSKKTILTQFSKCLIDGHEEIEYFEKIYSNRAKKLNKKEKKKDLNLIKEATQSSDKEVKNTQKEIIEASTQSNKELENGKSSKSHTVFDN